MTNRFARLASRLTLVLAMTIGLIACGGGGGGGSGGGFTGETPDTENPAPQIIVELALFDPNGDPTNTVTSSEPATLVVTVSEVVGRQQGEDILEPVGDTVVVAQTSIGALNPANGTALTDANGQASFGLGSNGTLGAGSVLATVEVEFDANPDDDIAPEVLTFTGQINFQVAQAALRLGTFDASGRFIDGLVDIIPDSIPAGGTAVLSVSVVNEFGERAGAGIAVDLVSDCALSGRATITPASAVTDELSRVEADYVDVACGEADLISASSGSDSSTATGDIFIASPQANSIEFVSTTPDTGLIALRGTGTPDRPETATVTFRVIAGSASDADAGQPLLGVPVMFDLSTEVGGLELLNTSGTTDANGEVQATVQSGNVSTSVRVTATIDTDDGSGGTIVLSAISDAIVVSTGLPDQNSISLSTQFFVVPDARQVDGIEVQVTVRMADKFNNPVADGTSATFTTEYGAIQSSCTTTDGGCSVIWTSQAPRFPLFNQDLVRTTQLSNSYNCPSHNGNRGPCPDSLGYIEGLRSTILVTAVGEETFIDANGNGLYDEGEEFFNLPEAFLDNNEDTVYTPELGCPAAFDGPNCEIAGSEETFVDFDGNAVYSLNVDPPAFPNGVYNGSLCPKSGDGIFCSRELLNVRQSAVLILGSQTGYDSILVDLGGNVRPATNQGEPFIVYIADFFNNRPPGGTTVAFATEGECALLTPASVTLPDTTQVGAAAVALETEGQGNVTLTLSGNNINFSETFRCNAPDPEPEPGPGDGDGDGDGDLTEGPG
ncbi:MAG: hypothetical protein AAGI11_05585 [Pseudomonadota bacterium]